MTDTHILVVEDQRAVAGALRMRLRGLGYDVLDIAKDGDEAIAKAGQLRPDLILMDIRLGDGIDGIEAARRIRSQYDIPVVYVTAYADNDLLDRARATEPAGFINKPFTTKDLLTTINLALHQPKGDGTSRAQQSRMREAVLTTDREGHISFLSSGAEQLTGWSRQAVIGQPLTAALTSLYPLELDAASALVNRVINEGEEVCLHRRGVGDDQPGDVLSALADAEGNRFGVALRFDGYTVESSLAVLQRVADASRFMLDQVSVATILIDPKLAIAHINTQAERILENSSSLHVVDQRLVLDNEHYAETLRNTLKDIAEGTSSDEATLEASADLLTLEAHGENQQAVIVAVARAVPDSNAITDTPLAALMLFDLRHRPQLSGSVLQQIYALTRSEVRLVQHLVGGCSLDDGADQLGISVNTARTHLKHIFHKTGAKRQSELIHIIETGPASLGIEVKRKPRPKRPRSPR